jgi:RNA polymerase sigma-70 factor (ECF subfamily)
MAVDMAQTNAISGKGQTSGFEAIFEEHWARVYELIFRLTGDRHEAEDLALEAFWRLYSRPPRTYDNLAGWLYRVATNLGFNALRAQKRRAHYEEQAGRIELGNAAGVDPAEEAERAEERRLVRETLIMMKPRSARLLTLQYSGFNYAEIASLLDLSPNSVGKLLARAEQEFIQMYDKEAGE